jgi:hypothetical protein
VAAAVVGIAAALSPVVDLFNHAAQRVAAQLVELTALVAHANEALFGVVLVADAVAVRLDAFGDLALAEVFQPGLRTVLVGVVGEVVFGVVGALHH